MQKTSVVFLLLIILLVIVAVFYFDILNLRQSRESVIASIINYEDARRASDNLIQLLDNPDPEIRIRAATAIGRIGDSQKAASLFKLFDDSIPDVAQSAAFALGLTGEKQLAHQLASKMADYDAELLASCIQALGYLTDSTMTEIIDDLILYLNHLDHRVREQAVYALFRANAKNASDHLIRVARIDPVRPVKLAALFALTRMRIAESDDLYAAWLPDSEPYARSLALRGLAIGNDDNQTALIASGLNDRDDNVVSQAILSLAAIGSPKALNYLVARYPSTDNDKHKIQLFQALQRMESDRLTGEAHETIYIDSGNVNIVSAAVNYLAQFEQEEIIPLIDTLAEYDNPRLRASLADALKSIGSESVKPRLNSFFKDSFAFVRISAFGALCEVDSENVDYYIKTALNDEDFVLTSIAIDKIGQRKDKSYLQQFKGLIRANVETDIKRSIVAAVKEILTLGADSVAEDILFRCLVERDHIVSKEAAEVYKEVLDVDKSAYIQLPRPNFSERKLRGLLETYVENPKAVISTNRGDIEFELYFDLAPMTVAAFIERADDGFYNNLIFHRVVPNFVIQGGCPRGDGWGGTKEPIRCEYNSLPYERGSVGIATSGKDTGSSQFFITHSPQRHLDGRYTLFGKVLSGMATVDNIVRGDTIYTVRIVETDN
jgi:cyclophilin family peptidyl-prolyl cis-trans isomerase/HEAT repeat protein